MNKGVKDETTTVELEKLLKQAEARLRSSDVPSHPHNDRPIASLSSKSDIVGLSKPYIVAQGGIFQADSKRLVDKKMRILAKQVRKVEDPLLAKQKKLEAKKVTAGSLWYNLPRTDLTPELKRDLQLLRMRSVLDPKRFYKKESGKFKPPAFSQVGTIIEGPTEFLSGRIPKKDRKRTLAAEVLAAEREDGRLSQQYDEIQVKRTSGKRGDYRKRMEKRYGKRQRR